MEIGTWNYNARTDLFELDSEACRLLGKMKDVSVSRDEFLDSIHREDRDAFSGIFKEAGGRMVTLHDLRLRIRDGSAGRSIAVRHKIRHFFDENNRFLGSLGVFVDPLETEGYLQHCDRFYQATENSINAVMFSDPDGNLIYVNSRFESIYGYEMAELIGKSTKTLNPGTEVYHDYGYSKDQYNELFSSMWEHILDPEIGFWNGQVLNRTKDGRILRIDLFIHAMKNREGEITSFVGMPLDITEKLHREQKVRISVYQAIADLAEQRDNETGKHMKRIGEYAYVLAAELGLSQKFCDDIRIFSPLHDIGKVGINDSLLLARRPLTEEEFERMKMHTIIGYGILKDKPTLEMAAEIAHCHQEKFDGSGYPRNLSGKEIPLSARITAIVDVYDALRSSRPYKEPFSEEKAHELIMNASGDHLDPELVNAYCRIRKRFDLIFKDFSD